MSHPREPLALHAAAGQRRMPPASAGRPDDERLAEAVLAALAEVHDPEIPGLSVLDLGTIEEVEVDGGRVRVRAIPTYTGCPALEMIRRDIRARLLAVPGVTELEVNFQMSPAWTTDRITDEGRRKLLEHGLSPPGEPVCPFCGSRNTRLDNAFGPTACRSIHYCLDCRNPFEHVKTLR